MLKPLEQYICDNCGGLIENIKDGWLEWIVDNGRDPMYGFRIVHAGGGCYYPETADISDNHLVYFTGNDGLGYLLSMTDNKLYPNGVNIIELAEIIRSCTLR